MVHSLEIKEMYFATQHLHVECTLNVSTCFDQMSDSEKRENIQCACDEKTAQDQLELPLVVELVELGRLNASIYQPFLDVKFTLRTRNILVRLRAMRVASARDTSQSKTICAIAARGAGNGGSNNEVNVVPH